MPSAKAASRDGIYRGDMQQNGIAEMALPHAPGSPRTRLTRTNVVLVMKEVSGNQLRRRHQSQLHLTREDLAHHRQREHMRID